MRSFITLPGIYGSEPDHWQSHWENEDPDFRRFEPASWDLPDLDGWLAALDRAVADSRRPPFLVAHSLSCLLVAHWAGRTRKPIAGALLVSVPDPEGLNFPAEAAAFGAPPSGRLPFPSLVIASSDDPYGSLDYMRRRAGEWGAGLVAVGKLGHIGSSSGLGDWPVGRALLDAFVAGVLGSGGAKPSGDVNPGMVSVYRLITGTDDAAFCRRITHVLAAGWRLAGSHSMAFNAKTGEITCGQAVVKEIPRDAYRPDLDLSKT